MAKANLLGPQYNPTLKRVVGRIGSRNARKIKKREGNMISDNYEFPGTTWI